MTNKARSTAILLLMCSTCCCFLGYSFLKLTTVYSVCGEPVPREILLNGHEMDVMDVEGRAGCASMNELWGEHEIRVKFKDGTERIVLVYPSIRDYDSSAIHIGRDKVKAYSLRYKIVK